MRSLVACIKYIAALEAEESARSLYRAAALVGAASCLAEVQEITDPIEQIKHLHGKFMHDNKPTTQWMPWAWLMHCVEKGQITKLPNEDWAMAVCIAGSLLEGDPALALQFIELN